MAFDDEPGGAAPAPGPGPGFRARSALRPLPYRGNLVAAGAVPLALGVAMVNKRLDASWGTGVFLVLDALVAALLLLLALSADPESRPTEREQTGPPRPRPYVAVLLLAGLGVGFIGLLRLSQVLGADGPLNSAGAAFWTFTVLALATLALWRARAVAVLVLVGALAGAVAVEAFVSWAFDPDGVQAFRWVGLLLVLAFVALHLVVRDGRRREGVLLVDAAGLVAFVLTYSLAFDLVAAVPLAAPAATSGGLVPAGWALVSLAAGFGLVAFAALEREPGPGFLGVLVLLVIGGLTSLPGPGGPSLVGWPLVLLVLGIAGLAVGLRPTHPEPPAPPGPGGAGPADTIALPPREDPPGGAGLF